MKKVNYFMVIALLCFSFIGTAQCKVQLKALKGEYTGDCKKGVAHGNGVAKGEDQYEGSFSKGYPDGEGVYTWANGNVYKGTFKKGKKTGQGLLTIKETGKEVVGYWSKDEYIGTEKNPYKVLQKPAALRSSSFRRTTGPNELVFTFQKTGKVVSKTLNIVSLEGSFGNILANGMRTTVQSVVFPFTGQVRIDGQDFKFRITQEGSWDIKLNI